MLHKSRQHQCLLGMSLNWLARKPVGIATNTFAVMETQVLITSRSANDFPVPALPTTSKNLRQSSK